MSRIIVEEVIDNILWLNSEPNILPAEILAFAVTSGYRLKDRYIGDTPVSPVFGSVIGGLRTKWLVSVKETTD